MPNRIDRIIDLAERLIASGRTRLLATLFCGGALVYVAYLDRSHAVYYAGMIVLCLALFVIAKSITDVHEGPAQNGKWQGRPKKDIDPIDPPGSG